jgi:hypothetical protein
MHASLWTFRGDPDELLTRFDGMLAEAPLESMSLLACLRTDDGLLVLDTCPSREAYEGFRDGEWFAAMLDRHGLPRPVMDDHPLARAVVDGRLRTYAPALASR